jgi:V/A-type H+-transporting ATPase subunit K
MNWLMLVVIGVGIPVIGAAIGAMLIVNRYFSLKERAHEFDMDENEFRRKNFGKFIIFVQMLATGCVFGILILTMFYISVTEVDAPDDTLYKVGLGATLAIGIPAFFSNISRGLISRESIEAIVKDPKSFGRALVPNSVVDTNMIYGLLIAILLLVHTGLLGAEFTATSQQVDDMLGAIIIFIALSSGILLSGVLFSRVEEPFSLKGFVKAMQVSIIGTIPPVIGLMIVILKFNQTGLI